MAEERKEMVRWHTYSIYAPTTCTVWWWPVVVVVVCGGGGGDCSYGVVVVNIYTVQVAIYHIYIIIIILSAPCATAH